MLVASERQWAWTHGMHSTLGKHEAVLQESVSLMSV